MSLVSYLAKKRAEAISALASSGGDGSLTEQVSLPDLAHKGEDAIVAFYTDVEAAMSCLRPKSALDAQALAEVLADHIVGKLDDYVEDFSPELVVCKRLAISLVAFFRGAASNPIAKDPSPIFAEIVPAIGAAKVRSHEEGERSDPVAEAVSGQERAAALNLARILVHVQPCAWADCFVLILLLDHNFQDVEVKAKERNSVAVETRRLIGGLLEFVQCRSPTIPEAFGCDWPFSFRLDLQRQNVAA